MKLFTINIRSEDSTESISGSYCCTVHKTLDSTLLFVFLYKRQCMPPYMRRPFVAAPHANNFACILSLYADALICTFTWLAFSVIFYFLVFVSAIVFVVVFALCM